MALQMRATRCYRPAKAELVMQINPKLKNNSFSLRRVSAFECRSYKCKLIVPSAKAATEGTSETIQLCFALGYRERYPPIGRLSLVSTK